MIPQAFNPAELTAADGRIVTAPFTGSGMIQFTDISWQDPQKDAYDYDDIGLQQPDALRYCEELVMGGYDDWRTARH